MPLKWTPLQPRQLVQFFDPNNPSNIYSPQINPQQITMNPGNVRQYQGTTNGAATIIGKREYPPVQIQLTWSQMDVTDYQGIAAFTSLSPIVYVDNNNNGYIGVLTIQQAGQIVGMSSNVWGATMNFLVLGPYNGLIGGVPTLIPQLNPNSTGGTQGNVNFTATNGGHNTGFIPTSTTIRFWLTFTSRTGESVVGTVLPQTTAHANDSIILTWNPDLSNYYITSKLYWFTTNTPSAATFLTEVQAGFPGTFTVYAPYVQYSLANPPAYGQAFMGFWVGGLWYPDPTH